MEIQILKNSHDFLGHLAAEKTAEAIKRTYWFPKLRQKIKEYISNCPKCIIFNSSTEKNERYFHSIPKGEKPFEMLKNFVRIIIFNTFW